VRIAKPKSDVSAVIRADYVTFAQILLGLLARVAGVDLIRADMITGMVYTFKLQLSESQIRTMVFLANASLVAVALNYLPWSYYLLTSYLGFKTLLHFAMCPVSISAYLFFSWYVGIPADFVFGPFVKELVAVIGKVDPNRVVMVANRCIKEGKLESMPYVYAEPISKLEKGQLPWDLIASVLGACLVAFDETQVQLPGLGFMDVDAKGAAVFSSRTVDTKKKLGPLLTSYWWKLRTIGESTSSVSGVKYIAEKYSMP